jgi:hypothetical protein
MEKYNITVDNYYKWDKEGFILGLAYMAKHIISLHAFNGGRVMAHLKTGAQSLLVILAALYILRFCHFINVYNLHCLCLFFKPLLIKASYIIVLKLTL